MRNWLAFLAPALSAVAAVLANGAALAAPSSPPAPAAPWVGAVKALVLWADEKGVSHFRETEFKLGPLAGADGLISEAIPVRNLWFRVTPPAQDFDWHRAPRRQLVVTLGGGVAEITAGDGERRLVKPGDIVIAEDVFGQGHKTRAFDGLPRNALFIELDAPRQAKDR